MYSTGQTEPEALSLRVDRSDPFGLLHKQTIETAIAQHTQHTLPQNPRNEAAREKAREQSGNARQVFHFDV